MPVDMNRRYREGSNHYWAQQMILARKNINRKRTAEFEDREARELAIAEGRPPPPPRPVPVRRTSSSCLFADNRKYEESEGIGPTRKAKDRMKKKNKGQEKKEKEAREKEEEEEEALRTRRRRRDRDMRRASELSYLGDPRYVPSYQAALDPYRGYPPPGFYHPAYMHPGYCDYSHELTGPRSRAAAVPHGYMHPQYDESVALARFPDSRAYRVPRSNEMGIHQWGQQASSRTPVDPARSLQLQYPDQVYGEKSRMLNNSRMSQQEKRPRRYSETSASNPSQLQVTQSESETQINDHPLLQPPSANDQQDSDQYSRLAYQSRMSRSSKPSIEVPADIPLIHPGSGAESQSSVAAKQMIRKMPTVESKEGAAASKQSSHKRAEPKKTSPSSSSPHPMLELARTQVHSMDSALEEMNQALYLELDLILANMNAEVSKLRDSKNRSPHQHHADSSSDQSLGGSDADGEHSGLIGLPDMPKRIQDILRTQEPSVVELDVDIGSKDVVLHVDVRMAFQAMREESRVNLCDFDFEKEVNYSEGLPEIVCRQESTASKFGW